MVVSKLTSRWQLVARRARGCWVASCDNGERIAEPWLMAWRVGCGLYFDPHPYVEPGAGVHASYRWVAAVVARASVPPPVLVMLDDDGVASSIRAAGTFRPALTTVELPGAESVHYEHLAGLRVYRSSISASLFDLGADSESLRALVSEVVELDRCATGTLYQNAKFGSEELLLTYDVAESVVVFDEYDDGDRGMRIFRSSSHLDRYFDAADRSLKGIPFELDEPVYDISFTKPQSMTPGWRKDYFYHAFGRTQDCRLVRVVAVGGAALCRVVMEREARHVHRVVAALRNNLAGRRS